MSRRFWMVLWFQLALLALCRTGWAHDLAIDQVQIWSDPSGQALRGQLTFDPELTRSKDAQPSPEYERKVLAFVNANLQLTLDGRPVRVPFEVRELWVRGGATLGDLVVFALPLPKGSRELRLFAGAGFRALVVSVQRVTSTGGADTTSWLLGRGEWTPVYQLGTGWAQPGWRSGGPDVFLDARGAGKLEQGAAPTASSSVLAARFVRLGFEHILPDGIDHMLFVAGLVLGSGRRYRRVLIALSLFTLAHTVTLALGNFQLLRVPPRFVEPLIALSILLLGVDNFRAFASATAATIERRDAARYVVVFCFGLIHGLGFANALSELAFERAHVVLALLSFNVGVELGQIAVVALLAALLYGIRFCWVRERRSLERTVNLAGSAAIAASGLYLVVDRLVNVAVSAESHSRVESSSASSACSSARLLCCGCPVKGYQGVPTCVSAGRHETQG